MSTPARSAATWRDCETPPKIVVTFRPQAVGQRFDGRGDLGGQFPGGGQHQAGRLLRPAAAAVEPADQGQGECQRLTAAGLAAAENVAAGQGVGQGFGLDGKGVVDAACAKAATSGSRTPRSAKDGVFTFGKLSDVT